MKLKGVFMEKKVAVPGEFLILEEEFLGGKNTFTTDEGNIYSNSVGEIVFNENDRTVNVKGKQATALKVPETVFAEVASVKDNRLLVHVIGLEDPSKRVVVSSRFATIRVADVSRAYVKSLRDAFKIGDLLKAKVSEVEAFGVNLRTNEPELGVVKAFCSKCRAPLQLFDKNLKCLKCGRTEARKVSKDYLLK